MAAVAYAQARHVPADPGVRALLAASVLGAAARDLAAQAGDPVERHVPAAQAGDPVAGVQVAMAGAAAEALHMAAATMAMGLPHHPCARRPSPSNRAAR